MMTRNQAVMLLDSERQQRQQIESENAALRAQLAEAVELLHVSIDTAGEMRGMELAYRIAQNHPVSDSVKKLADSYLRIVEFFEKHKDATNDNTN